MRRSIVFLSAVALSFGLQAQDAVTAVAGQKTNIPIKVKTDMSCSIEITLGARKVRIPANVTDDSGPS